MKFHAGDRVTFISQGVGTVKDDPTHSAMSILVDFNGTLIRIPRDGAIASGLVWLVKVEEQESYERT